MPKKIVKKRKIKVANLLIFIIVLSVLFFGIYYILTIKTKNILIKGTNYLNDDYIINLAGIKDYPKFISINSLKIEKKLNESDYIDKSKVKRKLGFLIEIDITENKPLFYDTTKEKYIFNNNEETSNNEITSSYRVPRLLNYVPDKKYKSFITRMNKINDEILVKISDIEYKPNDYDKDRFLLYMDDGNLVYLTLTKFKTINHYNEVLSQLENHKGILYLDSGNHFKIME